MLKNYIQARNKVAAEPNPIRRAGMHPPDPWSFEDSIARVFGPNGEFVDWTGRLFFSVTGADVVLTFQPTCGSGSSISFTNGYLFIPAWRFVQELRRENRMIRLLEIRLNRARTTTPGDCAF